MGNCNDFLCFYVCLPVFLCLSVCLFLICFLCLSLSVCVFLNGFLLFVCFYLCLSFSVCSSVYGSGFGLTPVRDRWIGESETKGKGAGRRLIHRAMCGSNLM
jgi:hypothetical protein